MFTKDEILVPVGLAEEKIREKSTEFEEKLKKMKEEHVGIVNEMKEYARQRGHAVLRSMKFDIGKPTPFFDKEGYRLYTGERHEELTRAFMMFEGVVKGEFLTVTRHFNTLSDGDEIAKGRKGAEGFLVNLQIKI